MCKYLRQLGVVKTQLFAKKIPNQPECIPTLKKYEYTKFIRFTLKIDVHSGQFTTWIKKSYAPTAK